MNLRSALQPINALVRRVKAVGRRVQAAAILVSLWLLYILGFGVTRLVLRLVRHQALLTGEARNGSWWRPAEGYHFDEEDWRRQS